MKNFIELKKSKNSTVYTFTPYGMIKTTPKGVKTMYMGHSTSSQSTWAYIDSLKAKGWKEDFELVEETAND